MPQPACIVSVLTKALLLPPGPRGSSSPALQAVDSSSHESTLRRSLAAASSKSKAPAKNKRQPPPANAKRPPPPLAAAPQAQRTLSFFGNFTAASPGGLNTPTCDHWQGFLQLLPETATYRSFQATSSAGVTTNCTGSAASQICRALASISTDPKSPQSALRGPFLCGGVLVGVDGRCGTDPSGRPLGVGLTYNTQNRIFPDSAVACRGSCTFFQAGGSIHPCMAGDAGWGGWGSPTCKGFAPPAVVQVACEVAGPA